MERKTEEIQVSNTTKTNTSFKAINMNSYLHEGLASDLAKFADGGNTRTGYANLDSITSLYSGLYFIGAISSLGKTTFTHQMADQLAKAGKKVLFFSLEQSTLELASKSLSRIMAQNDATTAYTSLQIRKKGCDSRVEKAIKEYEAFSENLTVIECSFSATIDDITGYVEEYMKQNNIKPVVIIDYLQVIQSEGRLSAKESVDLHVRRLKLLQSKHSLVMIVISSLNRQNYMAQIDFESFKESGGIEYTADVVWGLQLEAIHDPLFDSVNKLNEKREMIRKAKEANPRRVELVCLKNRFGISSYKCSFDYYPQFDWFRPDMNNIDTRHRDTDANDGWESVQEYQQMSFDPNIPFN